MICVQPRDIGLCTATLFMASLSQYDDGMANRNDATPQKTFAEAEIKVALTEDEFTALPAILRKLGFVPERKIRIIDYYIAYAPSPLGGYDFTRLRVMDGHEHWITEKRWIRDAHEKAIRLEEEYELSAAEFRLRLNKAESYLSLDKQRLSFFGRIEGQDAHAVLDHLVLEDRSYYFLECEVITTPALAADTRQDILQWMREHLPLRDIREAPSMLELLKSVVEARG